MQTRAHMHAHVQAELLAQQVVAGVVHWKHILSLSLSLRYAHINADTTDRVLRALLTPDLVYKWNNSRMMWRAEKQSDSSTLLIRMMVLASCHTHTRLLKQCLTQKYPLNML